MQVFIAGATGVLGRRLVRRFRVRGDRVVGLVRSPEGAQKVRELGGEPRQASLFDAEALAWAADGCDVVIHAASAIPVRTRVRPQDWAMNDRIRQEGTRALTTCAARIGARCYVQQSVVWVISPPDDRFFDEETPPCPDLPSRSALDGELIAREAGEAHGFATAVLRCGWFYGADAAHTRQIGEGLRRRRIPVIGDGQARWGLLHLDDAADAFVTAAVAARSGCWHVVDDEPARVQEVLTYWADRLNAPRPFHVPVWLARLVAGSHAVTFFTRSTCTSNTRFGRETGWRPRYPTFREGIDQIATWASTAP